MSDTLLVSTRKGLFHLDRGAGGDWQVVGVHFLGDPVTFTLADARDGAWYASLDLGHFGTKLHRSRDRGQTWAELPAPAYPEAPDDADAPSTRLLWVLAAGGDDQPGRLWAGTIPGGLFLSEDHGASWALNEALWARPERARWFGGGFDEPGIHSISVDPRDSARLLVGVSCGGVWRTEDGGGSWELRAEGMFASYMPPSEAGDQAIQDPHRIVRCAAAPDQLWAQHHNGVFRTTDDGASWAHVTDVPASDFGFAVGVHPADPDTAWLVPAVADQRRVPVDGALVVNRTRDGGVTFETLRTGLPQEHAYDLVFRHALDVDATGTRLAFGSTTGGLWISDDGGDSFDAPAVRLPPVRAVCFA